MTRASHDTSRGGRLGLAFERVGEERLRLTFTNVDATDPMRAFAFQVRCGAPRHASARGCTHPRVVAMLPTVSRPALRHTQHAARCLLRQVFVDGANKYHVESCEPPVPGLDELRERLNADNDFARFVREMRKRFKALTTTALPPALPALTARPL